MADQPSKLILPGFRTNVPDVPPEKFKPAWNLPLYTLEEEGFQLDFGPLLLFDQLILDRQSVDFINDSTQPYLNPLRKTLELLRREKIVLVEDFAGRLRRVMPKIIDAAESELQTKDNVLDWANAIRKTYEGFQRRLPGYRRAMRDAYDSVTMETEFGTHVYQLRHEGRINPKRTRELEASLFSPRRPQTRRFALLQELIRPTVQYTYVNIALEDLLGAPFLDAEWTSSIYPPVYDRLLRKLGEKPQAQLKEIEFAQQLFCSWIPLLRPRRAEQFVALLRKKRSAVKDFRRYVRTQAAECVEPAEDPGKELLAAALELEIAIGKRRKLVSRGTTFMGTLLDVVSGTPAGTLAGTALGEGIDYLRDPRSKANLRWLYSLIEIRDL